MRWCWLGLVLATTACRPHAIAKLPQPLSAPAKAPVSEWAPLAPERLAPVREAVASLRALEWQADVPVQVGSSDAFARLLIERGVEAHERVAGIFVDGSIWLRHTASDAEAIDTLAHELTHALEAQHGLLRPLPAHDAVPLLVTAAGEAILARQALHEGVAMAVAVGVVAKLESGRPHRAIAELSARLEELSLVSLEVPDAPELFEKLLPYRIGPGLAGALYATGGPTLWTAVERQPPATLVEAMHPSLYLAGFSGAPRELVAKVTGPQPTHGPLPSWALQLALERSEGPVTVARWMRDYRAAELLRQDGELTSVVAFSHDATAHDVSAAMPEQHPRQVGAVVVFAPKTRGNVWRALPAPAAVPPPLPAWPQLAPTVYPLEHDPALAFSLTGRVAKSPALGLAWSGVAAVQSAGTSRSELRFDTPSKHDPVVSALLVRLPPKSPIENGLSLLVQAFVASEVARIDVHPEPPIESPAGQVFVRRVDTPDEAITVGLLPRCESRYALALVAFGKELSFEALRTQLAHLTPLGTDLESAACQRARAEEASDYVVDSR